jgi:flagellar biosynthesis protein FliP
MTSAHPNADIAASEKREACSIQPIGRRTGIASRRLAWLIAAIGAALLVALAFGAEAAAQQIPSIDQLLPPGNGTASGRVLQLVALVTVLSVAPGLMIMVTCFTRFVIALSFLRAGLGLQTTPANLVLVSLALFMTFYVMGPTFDKAWADGVKPLLENQIKEEEAFQRITKPFKAFMRIHVREKDLRLFEDLAGVKPPPENADAEIELRILIPAFMISELRRGFEIGFLITLPFLVIDMIVATLTMSMGMMMLPPTAISLPFKILFFILIDGWNLLIGGLVRSFLS